MAAGSEPPLSGPEVVLASVYLKSQSGKSLLKIGPGRPRDLQRYLPAPETVERAIAALEERGFTIEAHGVTISISGPPELFEKVCKVDISLLQLDEPLADVLGHGQLRVYRASKRVMNIEGLDHLIEGIVLAAPGVPF